MTLFGLYSASSLAEIRTFNYKTGQVRATANYVDYLKNGEEIWYYKSGAKKSVVNYIEGLKQGFKYIYKKNGELKRKKLYKDNFIVELAKTYSEAKKDVCIAKSGGSNASGLDYKRCELAVDDIFGDNKGNDMVVPLLNELKSIYKK